MEGFLAPPSAPRVERIEALIRSGDFTAAISAAQELIAANAESSANWRLLHLALMGQRKFDLAQAAIEEAVRRKPNNKYYRKLLAVCLKENGKFDAALALVDELLDGSTWDTALFDVLKVCHFRLGNVARAIEAGDKRLRLLDQRFAAVQSAEFVPAFAHRDGKRIVSFCLWGKLPQYCVGAMVNARLVKSLLPDWTARFYLADDVPDCVVQDLKSTGAEIVLEREIPAGIPRYMWRFLAIDDPSVARFLCRDCDARISAKEVAAIEDWMASGIAFHVMRDHVFHCDLILAGLWGGIADRQLMMEKRIKTFRSRHGDDHRYGVDQSFLAWEIWPLIRGSVLSHDSYYQLGRTRPFPVGGKGNAKDHVGARIVSNKTLREEVRRYQLPWPPDSPRSTLQATT